jgi:hypothetical protein
LIAASKRNQRVDHLRVILLSDRGLEPYFFYERSSRQFEVDITVISLDDLALSPAMFGLGGGIFFLGYFLFEVPSNLILYRVGARLWIARVMVTLGYRLRCAH